MSAQSGSIDHLTFVELSPVARRLLWHLYSIGSHRLTELDQHQSFEKPGAHLFWVQSGEGELAHETGHFALRCGKKVWLVDMSKPRSYSPLPKRYLTITGFRFGGPGLEFWRFRPILCVTGKRRSWLPLAKSVIQDFARFSKSQGRGPFASKSSAPALIRRDYYSRMLGFR